MVVFDSKSFKIHLFICPMLKQILQKFHERGWDLYLTLHPEPLSDIVERGPVCELSQGNLYLVLPEVESPYNYKTIMEELQRIEQTQRLPAIQYGRDKLCITFVKLNRERGLTTDRGTFLND